MVEEFYEPLIYTEKKIISDGMGSYWEDYVDGTEFMGAITLEQSIQARIAEQQGLKTIFTITTSRNIPLKFSDVIKRKSTGEYFKIGSNGFDMQTPSMSNLDIQQVTAERFTIPAF